MGASIIPKEAQNDPSEFGVIQHGDNVAVYERPDAVKSTTIDEHGIYQSRDGIHEMKDWIGREYGTRLINSKGKSIYVVKLTPELWTLALTHRTQVLYVADIAMVVFKLELKPGALVLETGTGTGSLTTSLARAVAPHGKVATFDYHEERVGLARKDFERHGIDHVVDVTHRDTQRDGFPEEYIGKVDAVFLDLPMPWLVIGSAAACLRPDGMVCSFSPCIEQVQRTCDALNSNGFKDIQTMEILLREHQIVKEGLLSTIDLMYIQQGRRAKAATKNAEGPPEKKKVKLSEDADNHSNANGTNSEKQEGHATGKEEANNNKKKPEKELMSKPVFAAKGHTGYLTFARRAVSITG
eukprot:CAMPEP_0118800938 /NCGR_PEP_ID=MMETSP1161-20130426/2668_1 /TAXON_ID=249345 /ORGANISM="Picochlorum oklahomensis, Strain CCMP2329" /LENGTH=353 /DNA_ID=CAMNT_0006728817 /DNA_START=47 /DNA_END=1108 /DNA_ORIENTATION=+